MIDCNNISKINKKKKLKLLLSQIILLLLILFLWETLAYFNIIDDFLFSRPSKIFSLLIQYIKTNEIFKHIYISVLETILGIILGTSVGILIAIVLWSSNKLSNLLEPFLVILNALPKTALAPIMIIWAGTGISGIVVVRR